MAPLNVAKSDGVVGTRPTCKLRLFNILSTGYTSCISFGHHKVSLWPQSLPLDYSDSITIPEIKHAPLITLQHKEM